MGSSPKLKPGWSLPFLIRKRITPTAYELEALNWSLTPFKIIRGLTNIKIYKGKLDFSDETREYDVTDFQARHEFEGPFGEDEEINAEEEPNDTRYLTQETPERIRLSTGTWITRDHFNNTDTRTDQFLANDYVESPMASTGEEGTHEEGQNNNNYEETTSQEKTTK